LRNSLRFANDKLPFTAGNNQELFHGVALPLDKGVFVQELITKQKLIKKGSSKNLKVDFIIILF
jgi:hypothetical protein